VYGAGEYIGEMSLDGGPRSASVAALVPTVCAVVTRELLVKHIAQHPEFAFELISRVIRRARLATHSARSMALLSVYGRLAQVLESMAESDAGHERLITPRPTHADLASRIGSSREMVSRLMKDLATGGYVRTDPEGLWLLKALPPGW